MRAARRAFVVLDSCFSTSSSSVSKRSSFLSAGFAGRNYRVSVCVRVKTGPLEERM